MNADADPLERRLARERERLEHLEADEVKVARSAVGGIDADRVEARGAVIGGIRADDASVRIATVGGILANEVRIRQGAARAVLARSVRIEQGGAGGVVAGSVTLGPSSGAVFVLAGRVDGEVRSVFDLRTGLVVAGLVGALALVLRRGRSRPA